MKEDKIQMPNTRLKVLRFCICSLGLFWNSCCVLWISNASAQDKIVAIVNNDVITQKDLNDFINFTRMQLLKENNEKELENKIQSIKQDLLERLIEDRLILQEAKKSGIKVDEARVKARINDIRRRYSSDAEFQDDLARQGLVQADLESKIRDQLLMYTIISQQVREKVIVRPDEVTEFYNKNLKDFVSLEERQLEVITLDNEDLAKSFAFDFKAGKKLEELATRYPITGDKLKAKHTGELRKDIEDAVFKLGIDEVSDPIKVNDKYYVFKLDNLIPAKQLSLSEAQDRIHDCLFDTKMQEGLTKLLDGLKEKSYIKVIKD